MALYREFTTQEEIDWEYDPVKPITEPGFFEKIIEGRKIQSATARKDLGKAISDVKYGPTVMEKLDIFPAEQPNAPIVVFIHGGYWFDFRLVKENYIWVARGLRAHGFTTVVIDYDVCPAVTIDEITRSCRAAVAWTYDHATEFGGDPNRIYVTGNSAGGHLTAMLAVTDWVGAYGRPADLVKGGCPISGLYDLEPFPYSWLQPKLQLTGQQVRRNSPILHVPDSPCPLLVSWGNDETAEFARQSTAFSEAWIAKGGTAPLLPQIGKNHFYANDGFFDPDSSLCRQVVDHADSCWK